MLLWTPPFSCDITDFLHPGENSLVLEVTNLLPNRLIGDEQHEWNDPGPSPQWPQWVLDDLPRSPSGRLTWSHWKGWSKTDQPIPSGILGPAAIHFINVQSLD